MRKILSLTGFMGCGKTSVGRALEALSGCRRIDLDEYIEAAEGRSIPAIFSSDGEKAFRKLEEKALKEILSAPPPPAWPDGLVLSLGGGTLTHPACAALVRAHTVCIYLRASIDTLLGNLAQDSASRPVLQAPVPLRERISALLEVRRSVYEDAAQFCVDVDGLTDSEIARKILSLI